MLEGTEKTERMPPLYFNCGGTVRLRQETRYLEQTYATQIEGWLEIYAGWPHHGGAHFHISCAGDERRDKASKNTSTPLQTAGSARISPSQAIMSHRPRPKSCMMETSHNAVQRLARYWRAGLTRGSDGKLTRSDNSSTRSQTLRLYAAALHPPSSFPAGSALRFTLQQERRITSTLVSGFPPPPSFSFLPRRRWKCDFLLHLGDNKTGQEENLKLFIAALHNKPVSFELQRGRFRKMRAKRQNVMLNLEKTRARILSYMDPTQAFTGATSTCPWVHSQNRTKQQFNKRQILH